MLHYVYQLAANVVRLPFGGVQAAKSGLKSFLLLLEITQMRAGRVNHAMTLRENQNDVLKDAKRTAELGNYSLSATPFALPVVT